MDWKAFAYFEDVEQITNPDSNMVGEGSTLIISNTYLIGQTNSTVLTIGQAWDNSKPYKRFKWRTLL